MTQVCQVPADGSTCAHKTPPNANANAAKVILEMSICSSTKAYRDAAIKIPGKDWNGGNTLFVLQVYI